MIKLIKHTATSLPIRHILTLFCFFYPISYSILYAETVHIPDPNLRTAIRDALDGAALTKENMNRLTQLNASDRDINNLAGLQYAENLTELFIGGNSISDLSPIADLLHLNTLSMPVNPISDLRPISNLTKLEYLDFGRCFVTDITPLAGLIALVHLECNSNAIVDVTPLAGLAALEVLEIQRNQIFDHSALANLRLSHFVYDQSCEMPPLPLEPRLYDRDYPSIFARWNSVPILNRPELSDLENLAYHDLRWNTTPFRLRFLKTPDGFKMVGDVDAAIKERDTISTFNPNMIHLVDVGIRAAPLDWFPEDSPYWIRDENGKVFIEIYEGELASHGLLDFTNPIVQERIVQQAIAVAKCGLFDGIFFDYWADHVRVLGGATQAGDRFFRTLAEEQNARDIIMRRIRGKTPSHFIVMGNTGPHTIPLTAPHINGSFMETRMPHMKIGDKLETRLSLARHSLLWLENNLRAPQVNCLEGYTIPDESPDSPNNRRWMRVVTTLSLTHSDGYVLFNHSTAAGHYWYNFWDADLGRPVGKKGQLYQDIDGLYIREFTNGWAVYNHSGAEQTVALPELASGVASGLEGTTHTLPNLDGEMYLRVKPANPADVNGDGIVNILDLTLVARALGTDKAEGDVNGDGVVNVFDLVFVAREMQ